VDEIPSPYLAGIMDEFFDGKMAPMIETNRGCPFSCTYCCQGTSWYTKVHYFSKERLREEIHYMARAIRQRCPRMGTLRIADSNYGMYERDVEISSYIGEAQKLYRWPTYIDATTGKNRPDRIIRSLEQVNGALVLYQAVQSLDENVLRNIKRQSIKLDTYEQLRVHLLGRGLRSNSDLILGLPGETLESYLKAVYKLLDSGLSQLTNFQLILLKGSELERLDSRRTFKFDTRFRIGPKNFGIYDGEIVFDVEEVVVATDTLSFEDYLRVRQVALVCAAFWHDNYFEEVLSFAERLGMARSEWLETLLQEIGHSTGRLQEFMNAFLDETRNELFATREACIDNYSQPEVFARLARGEMGDNLMHKYRAVASFHIWPEICECAMNGTAKALKKRALAAKVPMFDEFWADLHKFIYLRHAHGHSTNAILAPTKGLLRYDIAGWLEAGAPLDPTPFRWAVPQDVEFRLSDESREELEAALNVWTDQLKGLTKMVTRIRVACQVRDYYLAGPSAPQARATGVTD
jgi:Radical SAM superfamily